MPGKSESHLKSSRQRIRSERKDNANTVPQAQHDTPRDSMARLLKRSHNLLYEKQTMLESAQEQAAGLEAECFALLEKAKLLNDHLSALKDSSDDRIDTIRSLLTGKLAVQKNREDALQKELPNLVAKFKSLQSGDEALVFVNMLKRQMDNLQHLQALSELKFGLESGISAGKQRVPNENTNPKSQRHQTPLSQPVPSSGTATPSPFSKDLDIRSNNVSLCYSFRITPGKSGKSEKSANQRVESFGSRFEQMSTANPGTKGTRGVNKVSKQSPHFQKGPSLQRSRPITGTKMTNLWSSFPSVKESVNDASDVPLGYRSFTIIDADGAELGSRNRGFSGWGGTYPPWSTPKSPGSKRPPTPPPRRSILRSANTPGAKTTTTQSTQVRPSLLATPVRNTPIGQDQTGLDGSPNPTGRSTANSALIGRNLHHVTFAPSTTNQSMWVNLSNSNSITSSSDSGTDYLDALAMEDIQ